MGLNELITALVTNGIGVVCAAAVLWFAWYRETRTLPALIKSFTDAHAASQQSFESRNNKVVDTFARVIADERATCQKWHEENRERLDKLAAESRETRHYIRDLAHQIGMRKAVEEERARRGDPPEDR